MERARKSGGALLALRTGRGALSWVNLARKDKQAEPIAQVLQPEQIPVRQEGDATVRVLVGEGSPVRLGTPALVLDIELPKGGEVTTAVPPEFQGFAYVLEGEAALGANLRRARPHQLVLLGRGDEFRVTNASPGTRYLLMAGEPYGEVWDSSPKPICGERRPAPAEIMIWRRSDGRIANPRDDRTARHRGARAVGAGVGRQRE